MCQLRCNVQTFPKGPAIHQAHGFVLREDGTWRMVESALPQRQTGDTALETKTNLVAAAGDLLNAKDLQLGASAFAKAVINETLSDPAVHTLLVKVATEALKDAETQASLRMLSTDLLTWLAKEPWFQHQIVELLVWVAAQQYTTDAVVDLGNNALQSAELQAQGSKALSDVFWRTFEDKPLQEKAQAWLWESSVRPSRLASCVGPSSTNPSNPCIPRSRPRRLLALWQACPRRQLSLLQTAALLWAWPCLQ